ncbi:MAG TPA: hypothetical protein VNO14_07305 [Blastocatellia bacterium]|nr:hypothetical protein [Blastocatellia bacterium]
MLKRYSLLSVLCTAVLLFMPAAAAPEASMQGEFTLAGEWNVTSSPINNETFSRMGNTLGFPVRHMIFEQQGDLHTAFVAREDVGTNVNPLGVWRVNGTRFSATFQLWCPNAGVPCGSVVMRGEFTREDRIRGTMTAFFDEADPSRPTGYDTWTFSFRGDRIGGGAN